MVVFLLRSRCLRQFLFILGSLICTFSSKVLSKISLVQLHSRYRWYPCNAKTYVTMLACDQIVLIINSIYQEFVCMCNFDTVCMGSQVLSFHVLIWKHLLLGNCQSCFIGVYYQVSVRDSACLECPNNIIDRLERIKTCY